MCELKSLRYYYLALYKRKFPIWEKTLPSLHIPTWADQPCPSLWEVLDESFHFFSTPPPEKWMATEWWQAPLGWVLSHIMRVGITWLKRRSQPFPSHCLGPSFAWWVGLWDHAIDKVLRYQVSSPTGKSLSSDFWGGKNWEPKFGLGCKLHSPSKTYLSAPRGYLSMKVNSGSLAGDSRLLQHD